MKTNDGSKHKAVANKVALIQFLLACAIAAILTLTVETGTGFSALLGGAVSSLATLYMGQKLFSVQSADAQRLLAVAYAAAAMKIALVTALFCVVFLLFRVNVLWFLLTYLLTTVVYGLAFFDPALGIIRRSRYGPS